MLEILKVKYNLHSFRDEADGLDVQPSIVVDVLASFEFLIDQEIAHAS